MSGDASARDPYLVKSVVHASRLLSAFRSGEALPLREIAGRSAVRWVFTSDQPEGGYGDSADGQAMAAALLAQR